MNAKKVFSTLALVLGLVLVTSATYAEGITYESFFDSRLSSAPVEGKVYNEAFTFQDFFDTNKIAAPAKGLKYDAQNPMICWGGSQCLFN